MPRIETTRRWTVPAFLVGLVAASGVHAGEEPVNLGDFQVNAKRDGGRTDDNEVTVDRPALDRGGFSPGSGESDAPLFDLSPLETRPAGPDQSIRPVELTAPDYPGRALRKGITGYVTVAFTVNAEGRTERVEVLDARPAQVFDRHAVEAVRQWRFEPAVRGGKPVARRVSQTINFGDAESPRSDSDPSRDRLALTDAAAPEPLRLEPAEYPARALRKRETGNVTVVFTVNERGRTEDVEILSSSSRLFNQAVLRAVRNWKFEPPVREGKPEPVRIEHTIRFDL